MPKPLLYRPPPRWHLWTAFGGALVIHVGAVVAAMKREAPPTNFVPPPQEIVEATIQDQPMPTPPPEEILVPPPPLPPDVKPEFVEEKPVPPPQPKTTAKVAPVKSMGISSAKAFAVYAPRPPYPYEARRSNITGSGVCVVEVDTPTGNVTSATMSQSIGNSILDNAAASTFRQWRFRPGTVSKVRIPITFTMTGASY
jgi:TonB family protein